MIRFSWEGSFTQAAPVLKEKETAKRQVLHPPLASPSFLSHMAVLGESGSDASDWFLPILGVETQGLGTDLWHGRYRRCAALEWHDVSSSGDRSCRNELPQRNLRGLPGGHNHW